MSGPRVLRGEELPPATGRARAGARARNWPAHLAGVALGLTLLLTFVLTGHGLGASGFSTALALVPFQAPPASAAYGALVETSAAGCAPRDAEVDMPSAPATAIIRAHLDLRRLQRRWVMVALPLCRT